MNIYFLNFLLLGIFHLELLVTFLGRMRVIIVWPRYMRTGELDIFWLYQLFTLECREICIMSSAMVNQRAVFNHWWLGWEILEENSFDRVVNPVPAGGFVPFGAEIKAGTFITVIGLWWLLQYSPPSETHLETRSREISFQSHYRFWNFAQSTAISLSRSVHYILLGNWEKLWANEVSRDLGLRWAPGWHPILQYPPWVGHAYMMFEKHRDTKSKHTRLHWKVWSKLNVIMCILLAG